MRASKHKRRVFVGVTAIIFIPVFFAAPAATADPCVSSYDAQTIAANVAATTDVRVTSLVTCAGDDVSYQVPLSATVTFDGHEYSTVYATTNSVITFGAPDGTYWDYPGTPSISLYSMDWLSIPAIHPDEHLIINASDGGFQVDLSARPYANYGAVEATNIVITAAINTDGTVAISFATSGASYEGARTGVRLTDGSVVTLAEYGIVQTEVVPVLAPTPQPPTPSVEPTIEPTPIVTPTPEPTSQPVTPEPTPTPFVTPVEPTPTPEPTNTPEPVVTPSVEPTADVRTEDVRPSEPPTPEPIPPIVPVVPSVPAVEPTPATESVPTPVPQPEPVATPEPTPAPEPVAPAPEPVPEPAATAPDVPAEAPPTPAPAPVDPVTPPTPAPPSETVAPPKPEPVLAPAKPTTVPAPPVVTVEKPEPKLVETVPTLPSNPSPAEISAVISQANTILDSAEPGSPVYEEALTALADAAVADDPQVPETLANIPGVGQAAAVILNAFNTLGNLGADISPHVRKKMKQVGSAVIVLGITAGAGIRRLK